jgi:hypothetical protein
MLGRVMGEAAGDGDGGSESKGTIAVIMPDSGFKYSGLPASALPLLAGRARTARKQWRTGGSALSGTWWMGSGGVI